MVSRDKKKNGKTADETDKARVDLGFSTLIASLNSHPQSSNSTATAEPLEVKTNLGADLAPVKSEHGLLATPTPIQEKKSFEDLAEARQWSELAKFAESHMSNSRGSANVLATIWWGLAQLELGSIPASVLTSPIQRASAEVERFSIMASGNLVEPALTSSRVKKETAGLLLRLAKRNVASVSDTIAPEFFRRAANLDKTLAVEVCSVMEREIDRLNKMTGRKGLREARIRDLKAICADLTNSQSAKPTTENSIRITAPNETDDKLRVVNADTAVGIQAAKKSRTSLVTTLVFLIIVLGLSIRYLWFEFITGKTPFLGHGAASLVEYDFKTDASIPSISRLASVDNLEVLLAKVNSMAITSASTNTSRALGRQPGKPIAPVEMGGLLENEPPANRSGVKLEKVDTSGPIEGTVFYQREMRGAAESGDSVFGSQPPGVGGFLPNTGNGPRVYRVLTFTRVYSKASFFSQTIANLDSGARVEVVERFGEWLKIRSKSGQIGFMLAQDAEQLP
jgi:hypothetical protein